jgi:hypothetical protein
MNGTVDVHGLCFHWRVIEGKGPNSCCCTLHVNFGDLSTSRSYETLLSAMQAEHEAKALAPQVIGLDASRRSARGSAGGASSNSSVA